MGFWYHYSGTIHRNDALPKVEKLKHLSTYPTDQAKQSVEGNRIAERKCDFAITGLQEQFGRTHRLVHEHLDNLLAILSV